MIKHLLSALVGCAVLSTSAFAQSRDAVELKPFSNQWSADNGDGTFTNPIVNADFPDLDIVRVDDTYYMISTTMFIFPGATILKSHDLVNWEYCANPLKQIANSDAYNLRNGLNHYAGGQWATSLKYHNGKFYAHFIAFGDDGGGFLLTATDPEGEWSMDKVNGYYDNGVLFDDGPDGDGNVYVAYGIDHIRVAQITTGWKEIKSKEVISVGNGCEGSHMYHIGKYYYIYATYGGTEGSQTIFRATDPFGPYEEHKGRVFAGQKIHQGGLIDTPTGEWWTILFKDAGSIGRIPYLEPVKWVDGWPVIGNNGIDVSKNSQPYRKPDVGKVYEKTYLPTNDPFSQPELGMQWGWNHNPLNARWSLTQRPGYLRLKTASVTDDFTQARNTLTQRILGFSPEGTSSNVYKPSYGTAKFDVSGMTDGDICGLCVFQDNHGYVGVKMIDGKKYLVQYINNFSGTIKKETLGPELKQDIVYLRAICRFGTNKVYYYYSLDNETFSRVGGIQDMNYTLTVFVGNRFGLFNYATKKVGGYVDVDWFSTEGGTFVEEDYYTEEYLYPNGKPTAVDAPYAMPTGKTEYYSLSGVRLSSPQRGFNIVRHPDGTTSKVMY